MPNKKSMMCRRDLHTKWTI